MSTARPQPNWPIIHGSLFVAILVLFPVSFPQLGWPWFLLVPVASYAGVVVLIPDLRRTIPRLSIGKIDHYRLAAALGLCVATSTVLVGYQAFFHPDVSALAAVIPVSAFGSLFVAGVCFSLINAVLEELVFRWVLYETLAAEWGAAVAVGATALVFGLGHVQGYPPGPPGVLLAGLYGIALGLLRWWTGGLGLPIGCHITADATIFAILFAPEN